MNAQAYILNISGIKTLEELMEMESGQYMHTVEVAIHGGKVSSYTAPKWIIKNDIVFFYHAKTANQHNKRLRNYIKRNAESFMGGCEKYLLDYLDYADELYNRYGGKIYAVGRVCDNVEYSKTEYEHPHFKSRMFAPITDIVELNYPVSMDSFSEFLPITTQRAVTPVLGNDFTKLKSLILRYNEVPYLGECTSFSVPLKDIKIGNWLQSANESGRRYLLEWQFRKYYVDYFLNAISDDNKIYTECSCYKENGFSGIADNCILFNGKYLLVEVKRNTNVEKDLFSQLKKYCNVIGINLNKKQHAVHDNIFQETVLVIDTKEVFLYNHIRNKLKSMALLDNIKCMADIRKLKDEIGCEINDI